MKSFLLKDILGEEEEDDEKAIMNYQGKNAYTPMKNCLWDFFLYNFFIPTRFCGFH